MPALYVYVCVITRACENLQKRYLVYSKKVDK